MITAIHDAFTQDHHRCDQLLAAAESGIAGGDWSAIATATGALIAAMERHFQLEEEVVFPALAEIFQVAASPIEVMVSEHAQMRQLFQDLAEAVAGRDAAAGLGILETLHFLVQQHNYKEEGVLYPMADGALREAGLAMAALMNAH